jgi:RNA polymerase sigma factor (sigma-70 family)
LDQPEELLAIDQALDQLEVFDPRLARIVELRFFAGLRDPEIAEVLGLSCRTINREWKLAKAWLQSRLA